MAGKVTLESGEARQDFIMRRFYDEGAKRGEIAKELNIRYQVVFQATRGEDPRPARAERAKAKAETSAKKEAEKATKAAEKEAAKAAAAAEKEAKKAEGAPEPETAADPSAHTRHASKAKKSAE